MTLPTTLAGLVEMGRDILLPCVQLYREAFGLGPWEITARWVDGTGDDWTDGTVGTCSPDPVYQRATIEILWPPIGDVEETIAHEVVHCMTAELAMLAGAEPGTWALAAWERIAEQTARGAVALRRRGLRVPQILSRMKAMRSKVVALRRNMDPNELATIAVEGGAFTARDDVPQDVKDWIIKAVGAMAGGGLAEEDGGEIEVGPDGELPMAQAEAAPGDEEPKYMRAFREQLAKLEARLPAIPAAPAAAPPVSDLPQRKLLTQTIFAANRGVVAAETERAYIERGDHEGAERLIGEVRRNVTLSARRGSGALPPKGQMPAANLTDAQRKAAERHKISPERFATMQAQRQTSAALTTGRKN